MGGMDRRVRIAIGALVVVLVAVVAFVVGRAGSGGDDDGEAAEPRRHSSSAAVDHDGHGRGSSTTAGPDRQHGRPRHHGRPRGDGRHRGRRPPGAGAPAHPALHHGPRHRLHRPGRRRLDARRLRAGRHGRRTWVWLTEYRPSGAFKEWQAFVLHWSQGKGAWLVDLRLADTMGIAQVNVRQLDLTGDGKPEMVFGYHLTGSGSILAYDIVEGSTVPVGCLGRPPAVARSGDGRTRLDHRLRGEVPERRAQLLPGLHPGVRGHLLRGPVQGGRDRAERPRHRPPGRSERHLEAPPGARRTPTWVKVVRRLRDVWDAGGTMSDLFEPHRRRVRAPSGRRRTVGPRPAADRRDPGRTDSLCFSRASFQPTRQRTSSEQGGGP